MILCIYIYTHYIHTHIGAYTPTLFVVLSLGTGAVKFGSEVPAADLADFPNWYLYMYTYMHIYIYVCIYIYI